MTDFNYIVFAPNDWNGPWMNRQQLFSRIAKSSSVYYSTGPFFSWQVRTEAFRNAPLFMKTSIEDSVHVIKAPKSIVRFVKISFIDSWMTKVFCRSIRSRTQIGKKNILYIFHPDYANYLMHFNDAIIVYHAYDDFSKQGEYSADCKAREAYLLQKADLVFASSNAIKNHLVQLSEDANIKVLPNGVDYEQFNKSISEPDDIKEIPHPRVGYAGAINKKINLSLIDYLATELPLASFILVGRVANLSESDLVVFNRLKVKNNVYILGEKKPKDISDYMHGCDINIMPYKTDKSVWASSGYPLKLHEYLAVGKPTVSADIDAVREFKGVVDIPTDSKEWLSTIKKYINLPDDTNAAEARKNIAKANTWSDRVRVIQDEICRLLKSH